MELSEFKTILEQIPLSFNKKWTEDHYELFHAKLGTMDSNILKGFTKDLINNFDDCPRNIVKACFAYFQKYKPKLYQDDGPACNRDFWVPIGKNRQPIKGHCKDGLIHYEIQNYQNVIPCNCEAAKKHEWMNKPYQTTSNGEMIFTKTPTEAADQIEIMKKTRQGKPEPEPDFVSAGDAVNELF